MTLPRRPGKNCYDRAVFFDIDGTLLLTGKGRQAMNEAFHQQFKVPEAFSDVNFAGATDPDLLQSISENHGVTSTSFNEPFFYDNYVQRLGCSLDGDVNILPGTHEILRILRSRPLHLGIITGNYHGSATVKIKKGGFESYFEGGGFGEDGPERERIVATAIERLGVTPERSVVIGDSIHDVRTGKKHGLHTIAVETGTTEGQVLKQEDPDLLIPSLSPPSRLLNHLTSKKIL